MAVMKVFCGCVSTKSGALGILLLSVGACIAGIVLHALQLDGKLPWADEAELKNYISGDGQIECKTADGTDGKDKDDPACMWMDYTPALSTINTVSIVVYSVYLVMSLIAFFGASKDSPWYLMPWIVIEFLAILTTTTVVVIIIVFWAVYLPKDGDKSAIISLGVIMTAAMALWFYFWLCVVSHFQILREIQTMGLDEKKSAPSAPVYPFMMNNDKDWMNEEHTANTSVESYSPERGRNRSAASNGGKMSPDSGVVDGGHDGSDGGGRRESARTLTAADF
jgi:hypothetical protein